MSVPVGYIVAGYEFRDLNKLKADWDDEVHMDIQSGLAELAKCRAAGYEDWKLYALTEVAEPTIEGGATS